MKNANIEIFESYVLGLGSKDLSQIPLAEDVIFRPPEKSNQVLTPHETRVLKLLVEGRNYKMAAAELGVSVNTVSFHVRHIYEKLQVHSKSEAVAKALRNNLV